MKNLKNFLSESPTNSVGLNGLTGAANARNRIRKTFGQFKEHYLTKYKKSIQ
jgi:hypothetical protein